MALRHVLGGLLCAPAALAALADCNLYASACSPPRGRPSAVACPVTRTPISTVTACATDADCARGSTSGPFCQAGACGFDACFTDGDCTGGAVCSCAADFYGGNAIHGNECIPASCRVDGDCGAGSICAPSVGYCGAFEGFHCAPANADACGSGDSCQFAQEIGRFACQRQPTCSG
jgi:hypothetical protein